MATQQQVEIIISVRERLDGLERTSRELQEVEQNAESAGNALRSGFRVDTTSGITNTMAALSRRLLDFAQSGVEFGAKLETAQVQIASTLRTMQPKAVGDFSAAMEIAGLTLDVLKDKAVNSTATFDQLTSALITGMGPMFSAGITDLNQQLELIQLISNSLPGKDGGQIAQETRALLSGEFGSDSELANQLRSVGLSKEGLKEAQKSGKTFEYLRDLMKGSAEAAEALGNTFEGVASTLQDRVQQLGAQVFTPLREEIKDVNKELNSELAKPEYAQGLQAVAEWMATIVRWTKEAFLWSVKFFGSLEDVADMAVLWTEEVKAGFNLMLAAAKLVVPGIKWVFFTLIDGLQEKFVQGFAAIRSTIYGLAASAGDAVNRILPKSRQIDTKSLRESQVEAEKQAVEPLPQSEGVKNATKDYTEALALFESTAAQVGQELGNLEEGIGRNMVAREEEARKRAQSNTDAAVAAEKLTDASKKFVAVPVAESEEKKEKAIKDTNKALDDQLTKLRQVISTVNSNPFLTTEQKNAKTLPLLQKEEGLLRKSGAAPSEIEQNQVAQRMATPMGQFQAQWTQWVDGLGSGAQSAADAITGTLGAAIEGVSGALSGLILGTQNWRQAFAQAASSIIEQLINIGVQFVAHELLKMTVMDTTHGHASALRAQETAQIIQKNAQETASSAPNALMQSLASWGVSALVGAAAFAAAMALSGGFAEGGYTGGGARMEPAGVVHRGEYVFSQPAVNRLGISYLDSLHVNAKRGYAGGGAVGVRSIEPMAAAAGSQQPIHVNVMTSEDEMRRQLLNHPDADNRIVRVGRRRGAEMGIHRG